MRWSVLIVLVLAGCPAPRQYAVRRPELDCARAVRVANRTMVELGYTVTELVEPTAVTTGFIAGTKTGADGKAVRGRVRISCSAGGADLQPVEDALMPNYEFSRAFGYSFKTLVQRPDVETPRVEAGFQILLEAMTPVKARLDLGGEASAGGAVAIRVTVRNGTDREMAVKSAGIVLVRADGSEGKPLAGAALDAAVATGEGGARVRAELLERLVVAPKTTAVRFLVYPPGPYREARVSAEDVETGESDGFFVNVE